MYFGWSGTDVVRDREGAAPLPRGDRPAERGQEQRSRASGGLRDLERARQRVRSRDTTAEFKKIDISETPETRAEVRS